MGREPRDRRFEDQRPGPVTVMTTTTWRGRLAPMLDAELNSATAAERFAVAVDGGIGLMAVTAIAAHPPGPARAVEASRWIQHALDRGVTEIVRVITPGMSDDEFDALVEFENALARHRRAA